MPKNIVILCDGTSNEVSEDRTNILRLYATLQPLHHFSILEFYFTPQPPHHFPIIQELVFCCYFAKQGRGLHATNKSRILEPYVPVKI